MDTVSGRLCKYSRIPFRPSKDAYIEMPSLDSTTGKVLGQALNEALKQEDTANNVSDEAINGEAKRAMSKYGGDRKCRFIKKSGHCNVSHSHVADKPSRYLSDIFTTCVDLRWRWNLLLFSTAFIISWLVFAVAYWLCSFIHGDFDATSYLNEYFVPCVNNLEPNASFTSSFLFSLETQTTIGYGFRVVTEECPATIIFVVVQSVFGCVIDAFMIGLIMAKISRPKKRAETLLFSDKAVINMRDGQLCLMVRVGNLRKSHLVEATIRMQYLFERQTAEGELIPLEQLDLRLDLKNDSDRLFLVTPQTICHPIDKDSPLYTLNPDELLTSHFEVIVILEGMVEATGMTTQARASYLPDEILWGYRFENVISFSSSRGYNVDFCKFNSTYLTPDYPKCSAKEYNESQTTIKPLSPTSTLVKPAIKNTIGSPETSEEGNLSEGRDSGYNNNEDIETMCSNRTLNSQCSETISISNTSEIDVQIENEKNNSASQDNITQLQENKNLSQVSVDTLLINDENVWSRSDITPQPSDDGTVSLKSAHSTVELTNAKDANKIDTPTNYPHGRMDSIIIQPNGNDNLPTSVLSQPLTPQKVDTTDAVHVLITQPSVEEDTLASSV